MEKQVIITIGREYGSAGHDIGEDLARRLGIKFYDRAIVEEVAKENNLDISEVEKADEKAHVPFFSRTVRGLSNSMEDAVLSLESKFMHEKEEAGESFVLIGRCGEEIFKDSKCHISIFVRGDLEEKVARIVDKFHLNREDAIEKMERHDKKRKEYHNAKCSGKWGDSRTYDLCINSSPVGVDSTVNILASYVYSRVEKF